MRKPCPPPELDTPRQIKVAPSSLYSLGPAEICQGLSRFTLQTSEATYLRSGRAALEREQHAPM